MKILVICGDCLLVNTSANLCHLAYLRGLIDAGHEVSLISAYGDDYDLDPSLTIPKEVKCFLYYGESLYEKLSLRRKKHQSEHSDGQQEPTDTRQSVTQRVIDRAKRTVFSLYGVHGIYIPFVLRAKRFRSFEDYDFVLSLSTPATSHLLAQILIGSGRIKCRHWIQLWEDPWFSDVYGQSRNQKVFKEEKRLLSLAERICYVSPVTLKNQKQLFPESADKMFWEPLPAYYSHQSETESILKEGISFGYFGDYNTAGRNLSPFYEAAKRLGVKATIIGGSDAPFQPAEQVQVLPRMSLEELRPYEEEANVLVFLCNRQGGQIPGKIYQYSATSKTILFILDGSDEEKTVLKQFFEPFNRYVFCENSVDSIEQAINSILSHNSLGISSKPLTVFEPTKIVQRILSHE